MGFALPFFAALGGKRPSLVIAGYDVFPGTLVTCDAPLASAPGHRARIEVLA